MERSAFGTVIALAVVAPLLGGCAETYYTRHAFAVTYACRVAEVKARPAAYLSEDYTKIVASGCGREAEYDCTRISGSPIATPDDVVCSERARAAP